MPRHVHADQIHAWAEGEEIQFLTSNAGWVPDPMPRFLADREYRIKPRTVKREGWVNIYRMRDGNRIECGCVVYKTKQEALSCAGMHAIAAVRIEWEETVNE